MSDRKDEVVALLKTIEKGGDGALKFINSNKYIQHNLAIEDGLAGLGAALAQLPAGSARVNTVRVFEDGDFVFAHTEYDFFGPKIGFDIFRYENGKVVEHWDNLQTTPAHPNPSGHSMIDGTVTVNDLDKTEANKSLVRALVQSVLVEGRLDQIAFYIDADKYTQHNPEIGDGLSGLTVAFQAMSEKGMSYRLSRMHRVLGEGNFVLVVSEGHAGPVPCSFYDMFRVENGKVVEHWDVIEPILAEGERRNANGKF